MVEWPVEETARTISEAYGFAKALVASLQVTPTEVYGARLFCSRHLQTNPLLQTPAPRDSDGGNPELIRLQVGPLTLLSRTCQGVPRCATVRSPLRPRDANIFSPNLNYRTVPAIRYGAASLCEVLYSYLYDEYQKDELKSRTGTSTNTLVYSTGYCIFQHRCQRSVQFWQGGCSGIQGVLARVIRRCVSLEPAESRFSRLGVSKGPNVQTRIRRSERYN